MKREVFTGDSASGVGGAVTGPSGSEIGRVGTLETSMWRRGHNPAGGMRASWKAAYKSGDHRRQLRRRRKSGPASRR